MSKIRFRNQPDPLPPASGTGWLYLSPENSLSFRSYTGEIFSLVSSGISNIIEDTNPALGGGLDTNGFGISGGPFIQAVVITGTLIRTAGAVLANNGEFTNLQSANAEFSNSLTVSGTPVIIEALRSVTVSGGPATTGPNINFRGAAGGNVSRIGNTIFFHAPVQPAGGGGSGITDVVQDTSPQLGGNLDLNNHNIVGSSVEISNSGVTISGVSVPLLSAQRVYYFISGAATASTNTPFSPRFYNNSIAYVQKVDFSNCKEVRFEAVQVVGGSPNCRFACNGKLGSFSSTVTDYSTISSAGGNGELSIEGDTGGGYKDSGWLPLLPAYQSECFLAVVTSGGNGSLDPSTSQMKVSAR